MIRISILSYIRKRKPGRMINGQREPATSYFFGVDGTAVFKQLPSSENTIRQRATVIDDD